MHHARTCERLRVDRDPTAVHFPAKFTMAAGLNPLRLSLASAGIFKSLTVSAFVLMPVQVMEAQEKPKTPGAGTEQPVKTPSAKELMARGDDSNAKGDLDRAIADYDVALKIDPVLVDALNSRAMAWRAKGDRRRALTDLDAALKLKPDFEIARANRKKLFEEIERAGAHMPLKPPAPK